MPFGCLIVVNHRHLLCDINVFALSAPGCPFCHVYSQLALCNFYTSFYTRALECRVPAVCRQNKTVEKKAGANLASGQYGASAENQSR